MAIKAAMGSALILVLLLGACRENTLSFHRDIRPILNRSCIKCHGGVAKMGGLNLLFESEYFKKNERSGRIAVVPGSPGKSELIRRIVSSDREKRMPKDDHALSPGEIQLLSDWIRQGARWDRHWAYESLDAQHSIHGRSSGIDDLVNEQLLRNGLAMNKSAGKSHLLRRVCFDLTGLPPDSTTARGFVVNETVTYEQLIDSLLSSQHYGEHWAAYWMDLARYADSKGYERDSHRNIWRYRDWVIDAFNADMPLDSFGILQLAGDLLPWAGEEMIIATAFHRNTMTNTEGGTDDEEFRIAAVIDRLNTTMEIWQATTMSCAQCHDHPYDPISQESFYSAMAIFNNTIDADLTGEYPVVENYLAGDTTHLRQTIEFIKGVRPNWFPDADHSSIGELHFPKLLPRDADDFTHALLFPEGIISNWTMNVNDGTNRDFYFMFEDVPCDSLIGIEVLYGTSGDHAARLQVRVDELDGMVIADTTFAETVSESGNEWVGKNEWTIQNLLLKRPVRGTRDLVFQIINEGGKVPEGILLIKELKLNYSNVEFPPEWKAWQDSLLAIRERAGKTPVIREKKDPLRRQTRIFERGNPLTPGKQVRPGTPDILAPSDEPVENRLELANWLFSEENDLTARSLTNRIWFRLFGTGLVSTLEDLGTVGSVPANQVLLDHLAYRLKYVHEWRLKPFLKEILLSDTYRQSGEATAEKLKLDPHNLLNSRGPRHRLSSEQIRDQALAIGGLLENTVGGPSVMPYQPPGVWQTIYNAQDWLNEEGENGYRRGLYTYWKRSSPYPSMEAFDSPSREVCKGQRIQTNTPNQALVLMNDHTFIKAANALGSRMSKIHPDPLQQIDYAYFMTFSTKPDPRVKEILLDTYRSFKPELVPSKDQPAIESPAAAVAHVLFNMDAFYVK